MTAAVELRMPLGYVEMDAEEMEYLEGGAYRQARKTLISAKTYFSRLMGASGTGAAASALGCLLCGAFSLTGAYFGYVLSKATKCYNWVERQRYYRGNYATCTVSATTFLCFVTDLNVW